MPTLDDALAAIHASRQTDPLAPVTVVAPSHVAAIQLRRRLAALGPFAAVRFEILPRLAELLGADDLARRSRQPLARPIGDYVAREVAHEARAPLTAVSDLPGFARALRTTFRRLRRGGLTTGAELARFGAKPAEVGRLYDLFRARTAAFYDDEDLYDAAAESLRTRPAAASAELGAVYVLPPGALSAGAAGLLLALEKAVPHFVRVEDSNPTPDSRFVLAPDPASEAREAVREVIAALDSGLAVDEVAVFHGADRSYRGLLAQAFAAAGLPASDLPGRPLIETPAGRGVLALASLPLEDYSRGAVFDLLSLAPLRPYLPAADDTVFAAPSAWLRLAREGGVSRGAARWTDALTALTDERDAALGTDELSDSRRRLYEDDRSTAAELRAFVGTLIRRLEPLRVRQPAKSFVEAFKALLDAYFDPAAPCMAEVVQEIEQLGTIDAVGGSFDLPAFVEALGANLRLRAVRERSLGDGVLIADYRVAAGLRFRRVVLCGAYEGVFPAAAATDSLLDDAVWRRLRVTHPLVEDDAMRLDRSRAAALRAIAAVEAGGSLVWAAPLQAANGTGVFYPSSLMVTAAAAADPALRTATDLRARSTGPALRRTDSPLASMLRGPALDLAEARLRRTLDERKAGISLVGAHPLRPGVGLLRGRRGRRFAEYDGNLAAVAAEGLIRRPDRVSPTSLEAYAACGYRYFLSNVLRLRGVDEQEERDTIDPLVRGTIVHAALDTFFRQQQTIGRPASYEQWTAADRDLLLSLLDAELAAARARGRTGLAVYAEHDRRELRADLEAFLVYDNVFRDTTGAVPIAFELPLPEAEVAGVRLAGRADRMDQTPDGARAWIIDYKTGSSTAFKAVEGADDPLVGGTKLQLPFYLTAASGEVTALYWFISRRYEFARIPYAASDANAQRFEATLNVLLDSIAAGAFPAVPGDEDEFYGGFTHCNFCDFNRLCSRRRDYELAAKLDDAALQPWLRIAAVARNEQPL